MREVIIVPYDGSRESEMLSDIAAFWRTHYLDITPEQAAGDLNAWTAEGHELYAILQDGETAGFLHLGSRGGACDWMEDIFVREDLRGRGIGGRSSWHGRCCGNEDWRRCIWRWSLPMRRQSGCTTGWGSPI